MRHLLVKVLEGMCVAAFTAVGTALGQRLADEINRPAPPEEEDPPDEEYTRPRRRKGARRGRK